MRSVKALAFVGIVMVATTAGKAADMPQFLPPPMPPIIEEVGAGWYLRGDIGMTNQEVKSVTNSFAPTVTTIAELLPNKYRRGMT